MNCYNCKGEYKVREWHNGLNTILICANCYDWEKRMARLIGVKTPVFNNLPFPVDLDFDTFPFTVMVAVNREYEKGVDTSGGRAVNEEYLPFWTIKLENRNECQTNSN